jgi:hypothetical protein
LAVKHRQDGTNTVVVGYTANYAVYVHERPAKHAPGKQMKFLEQPARELSPKMGGMLAESMSRGVTLLKSLYLVGLRLQRNSQQLVPVDTGNLRGGAFTAREDDLESVSAAAQAAGESVRSKVNARRTVAKNKKSFRAAEQSRRTRVKKLKQKIVHRHKQAVKRAKSKTRTLVRNLKAHMRQTHRSAKKRGKQG